MTKLAILGDIHGNLPALEAVWQDMQQFEVDLVVVAGDSINWGPFSLEVLEWLHRERCAVIRGNNELYVVEYDSGRAPAHWDSYSLPVWLHRHIGDDWKLRVSTWPDTLQLRFPGAPLVRVIHGSPRDHWEGIFPTSSDADISRMLTGIEEPVVIAAHTHLTLDRTCGDWRIFNPGAVGIPLDSNPDASYMLLTAENGEWTPEFRRVPYDRTPLYEEFERQGFLDEHGIAGHFVIEEFRSSTIHLAAFLHWHRACCPEAPHSMDLLEHFTGEQRRAFTPLPYQRYI
jgi:predicted phosphodiesterase